jgi:hypothetical protein
MPQKKKKKKNLEHEWECEWEWALEDILPKVTLTIMS